MLKNKFSGYKKIPQVYLNSDFCYVRAVYIGECGCLLDVVWRGMGDMRKRKECERKKKKEGKR
jgi:hypothetical protein